MEQVHLIITPGITLLILPRIQQRLIIHGGVTPPI